jgi:ribosomal RNA-processing protein 9
MPRLSLRKKSIAKNKALNKVKVNAKQPRSKATPLQLRMKEQQKDEEISSDEDDDDENNGKQKERKEEEEEEEEDDEYETAEEKRRRLALQYLKDIGQLDDQDEAEEDDDEDPYQTISAKLKKERLRAQGRLELELTEKFTNLTEENYIRTNYSTGHHHTSCITSLAVPLDESFIVTGSKDNSVIVWNTETGQSTIMKRFWQRSLDHDLQAHHSEILTVAVTSDGKYIVSGGKDRVVRIHDPRIANSEIHCFSGHRDTISGLAFQTNSYALFSSSYDRCIKYYDLKDMFCIETLFGHQVMYYSIAV